MSDVTALIKLNVPIFDQDPWDEDVNENWQIIDALVGKFTSISNLVGVWKNSTAYTYGESCIDGYDGSIWTCIQANTSSAAPQTFTQERVQYPARWGATQSGAQYYSQQAAISAQAASQSAADAAASAAKVVPSVPIAGGTMQGALILSGNPTNPLGAATKQYVDGQVGGINYLPITGGALTGTLIVGSSGIAYSNQGGNAQYMSFGWDGNITAVVNNSYVGHLATQDYVYGNYLALGGGTIYGALTVNGEIHTPAILRLTNSGAYFYTDANYTHIVWDGNGWDLRYNRSNGFLNYLRGSDGFNLFQIDGGGNMYNAGSYTANGDILTNPNMYARGGSVFFGAGDRARLASDNSSYSQLLFLDNYGWFFNWSNGTINWHRYDGVTTLSLDNGGSLAVIGNISCNGTMTAQGAVSSANSLYAVSSNMVFGNGGMAASCSSPWCILGMELHNQPSVPHWCVLCDWHGTQGWYLRLSRSYSSTGG